MPRSARRRTMGLKPLFRCPYCPRGAGVVNIDLDVLVAPRQERDRTEYEHLTGEDAIMPRFVVFDADAAAGRPCPHLIDFTVGGFLNRLQARGGPSGDRERVYDFCVDWRHRWFRDGDPDGNAHRFLWEVVDGDEYQAFWPAGPYRLRWVDRAVRVPATRLRLYLSSCSFVAAADPEQFCQDLLEGDRRLQAFWCRQGAAEG